MKAKFRKRAMLHCTATSSTQHIKKLWSLNKKCKSYQANCEILSKSKMAAAYFQFPWQPMGKNIFFQNFLNYNHTRVFTVKKIVNTSIIEDFRKKHQQMALTFSGIHLLIKDGSTKRKNRTMEVLSCRSWPESTGYFHLNKICS